MRDLIALVYGLSFFSLGVAAAANRALTATDDRIVKGHGLIAAFGLLHGLAEWSALSAFTPLASKLEPIALAVHGLSFIFLALFGITLSGPGKSIPKIRTAAAIVFLSWAGAFFIPGWLGGTLVSARSASRLMINLPAGLICSAALFRYSVGMTPSAPRRLPTGIRILASAFGIYSLLSGLPLELSPMHAAWAPWLELSRATCAVVIAILYTNVHHYLEWEARRIQRVAQRRMDATEERRRLADDLHDRVIQRLYGLGLELEGWRRRNPESGAVPLVMGAIQSLNWTIGEIRSFLSDTASGGITAERFRAVVNETLEDVRTDPNLQVITELSFPAAIEASGSHEELTQLARVFEEAIRNARRHSRLSRLELRVREDGPDLLIEIRSLGERIASASSESVTEHGSPGSGGYGLQAIRHRVTSLGGRLELSVTESGSRLSACIPWRSWNG